MLRADPSARAAGRAQDRRRRGEPQQRVERHDEDLPTRKAVDGEGRSQRRPEQRRQSGCTNAYRERERDDAPERSRFQDGPQIPVGHRSAEPSAAAFDEGDYRFSPSLSGFRSALLATAPPPDLPANVPNRIAGSTSRSTIARFRAAGGCRWPSAGCGRRKRRLRDHGFLSWGLVRARGGAPPYAHGSSQSRRQRGVWSRSLLKASSSFDAARVG